MKRDPKHTQRGAALITVLMIVAAMSVVAVSLTRVVGASTQRAKALDIQAQLRFHLVSAEQAALVSVTDLVSAVEGRLRVATPGLAVPQVFPIELGQIVVEARDATNCFNLNSLVTGNAVGGLSGDRDRMNDLEVLLFRAGVERVVAADITAAIVDWIDADLAPELGGAEDAYYLGLTPPYRTAGVPLAEMSELRAIRHVTPEVLPILHSLTCVRSVPVGADPSPLNLNTLTAEQAPLLAFVFSGALTNDEAVRLIEDRPLDGWADLESFVEEPSILALSDQTRRTELLGFVSSYMDVSIDVAYRGQAMKLNLVLEVTPGRPVMTFRRERLS